MRVLPVPAALRGSFLKRALRSCKDLLAVGSPRAQDGLGALSDYFYELSLGAPLASTVSIAEPTQHKLMAVCTGFMVESHASNCEGLRESPTTSVCCHEMSPGSLSLASYFTVQWLRL